MNALAMHAALIGAFVLPALAAAPASARSSYCSPSGDYCKRTYKKEGKRYIELRTAALYNPPAPYELCVKDPKGRQSCRTFRLREGRHGVYVSRVRWSRHFPTTGGGGTYRITWDDEGFTYGPSLTFRR